MTFLPIVDRELRVAARKRSTFWLRVIAALVALVIGSGFLAVGLLTESLGMGVMGIGRASLGKGLFVVLTWLCLAVALSAGIFFTSDCLSEEKREGTLGFLFLTDLRGYDVVLGKLLATSLRGGFALLAVLPMLAVTLLLGAVAGPEFWQTMLALANALFVSLAAGLFVSVLSRDAQRAMLATVGLLFVLVAGGPMLDALITGDNPRRFGPFFSLTSPGFVFVEAGKGAAGDFWRALLIAQAGAWLLLAAACLLVRRTWQEKSAKTSVRAAGWTYWWKYGGPKRRGKLRQKLMDRNPMLWLACRERWQSVLVWIFVGLMLALFVRFITWGLPSEAWLVWGYVGGALTFLFYLGVASQAGRCFVEARRSGLLEVLLATPLPAREIALGQWRALSRMFRLPIALFLGMALLAATLSQEAFRSMMGGISGQLPHLALALATAIMETLITAANLVALAWFGMWMGMTSKNANLATLKTVVFVQIVPGFVIGFASSLVLAALMFGFMIPSVTSGNTPNPLRFMNWYPFVNEAVVFVLSLAKDIGFVVWARRKLFSDFREVAARALSPVRIAPPAVPSPPVIAQPAGGLK